MRKKAQGTISETKIPKSCPFCGANLDPLKMKNLEGQTVVYAYMHPSDECVLANMKIYNKEVEKWNRREKALK